MNFNMDRWIALLYLIDSMTGVTNKLILQHEHNKLEFSKSDNCPLTSSLHMKLNG